MLESCAMLILTPNWLRTSDSRHSIPVAGVRAFRAADFQETPDHSADDFLNVILFLGASSKRPRIE